jgi:hypothetical protein
MENLNHFLEDSVLFIAKFSTFEKELSLDDVAEKVNDNTMRLFLLSEEIDGDTKKFDVLISINGIEVQSDVNFMYAFYWLGSRLKSCRTWMWYLNKCDKRIGVDGDFDEIVEYLKDKF